MAHGMAVVSTRHAGILEAVIEGKTGLLVDEGDVEGMAQAFLAVGEQAQIFGEEGYTEAVKRHSWVHERDRLRGWLFS
jgi:glycosyltransferase involved in cell wall biosynthesis